MIESLNILESDLSVLFYFKFKLLQHVAANFTPSYILKFHSHVHPRW